MSELSPRRKRTWGPLWGYVYWETNNHFKRSLDIIKSIFSPGEGPAQTSSVNGCDTAATPRSTRPIVASLAQAPSLRGGCAIASALPFPALLVFHCQWPSSDANFAAPIEPPTCHRRRRKKAALTSHRVTACRAMAGAAPLAQWATWWWCSSPTAPLTAKTRVPLDTAMDAKRITP